MNTLLLRGGQVLGVIGLVLVAVAVLLRLTGIYLVAGFESGSVLLGGIATLAAACFALLWVLVERTKA